MIETFWRDLKYGVRMLARSPGFTAIAIITLALGIGANTAIFSVVNGVVLAPLPYHEPDRLVMVYGRNEHAQRFYISYPDFQDWQHNSHAFQQMAAFREQAYDLTGPGDPAHLSGKQISSGFFSTLGIELKLGREFSAEENRHGATPVVIVSERLWRERLGGSAAALGKTAVLNGTDYTLIGVVPSGFEFENAADVYTPLAQSDPLMVDDRGVHAMLAVARLKRGTSLTQAQAELNTLQKNISEVYPNSDHGLSTELEPLKQAIVGDVRGTLLMLFGSVGLVLLIACANVASLLLARSAARSREFAIRAALGASRAKIVGQLLTESVLLSLTGAVLGLGIAQFGVKPVLAIVPGNLPRAGSIGVDASVLLFTVGVSIVVGILFGLAPALKSWNSNYQGTLKEAGRGSTRAHHRVQHSLVIGQVALTLVLLTGAGLLFRTIRHLWAVSPGFDTQHVLTFKVGISPSLAKSPEKMRSAYQQLVERIRKVPGVQAADLTTLVPLTARHNDVPFWIGPHQTSTFADAPRALTFSVGPDYFRAMGIPLLEGRFFTAEDTVNSSPVMIIDSALRDAYFHNSDPIDQTITIARVGTFRVIGVVGHVKHWSLDDSEALNQVQAYGSFYQISDQWLQPMHTLTTMVVRTPLESGSLMPMLQSAVHAAGNDQPIYDLESMQHVASESMSSQSFPMVLLGAFAALALVLASVGIYGLLAHAVHQRTQEIGIRLALGAQQGNVFRMVVGQGLRLAATGIVIGVAAAFILARVLSSFSHLLYGVGANDPGTLAVVSLILAATTALACYVPARRAMRVAPTEALRYE